MIQIKLPGGLTAMVNDGVWVVPDNEELARVLNDDAMQPPQHGYYAPSEDARKAEHVLKVFGGTWLRSSEHAVSGKLY